MTIFTEIFFYGCAFILSFCGTVTIYIFIDTIIDKYQLWINKRRN